MNQRLLTFAIWQQGDLTNAANDRCCAASCEMLADIKFLFFLNVSGTDWFSQS
jgi:hypothetical protein